MYFVRISMTLANLYSKGSSAKNLNNDGFLSHRFVFIFVTSAYLVNYRIIYYLYCLPTYQFSDTFVSRMNGLKKHKSEVLI